MPPKKTTRKATKKSAGKKPASKKSAGRKPAGKKSAGKKPAKKRTRKTPETEDQKIKSIQEGKSFAFDKSSVENIFRAALKDMGLESMSMEGAVKEKLLELTQARGEEISKRAYMIDKHKDSKVKTISGDAVQLAYGICAPYAVDQDAARFIEKSTTPSLKQPQLRRLIKASVPMVSDENKFMSVSKAAKEQMDVILSIYLYLLAKNTVQFTTSARRQRISLADIEEGAKLT